MKEKIYYIGAIMIYVVYYFITGVISYYTKTIYPLLFSNLILFFIWMAYVDKKWKDKL